MFGLWIGGLLKSAEQVKEVGEKEELLRVEPVKFCMRSS